MLANISKKMLLKSYLKIINSLKTMTYKLLTIEWE